MEKIVNVLFYLCALYGLFEIIYNTPNLIKKIFRTYQELEENTKKSHADT